MILCKKRFILRNNTSDALVTHHNATDNNFDIKYDDEIIDQIVCLFCLTAYQNKQSISFTFPSTFFLCGMRLRCQVKTHNITYTLNFCH